MPHSTTPSFSNPFSRKTSTTQIPRLTTRSESEPLLHEATTGSTTSSLASPPPRTISTWRNRTTSIFQSISSQSSASSINSTSNNNYTTNNNNIGMMNLQKEREASMVRKQSYVPRYAAAAHLASMGGRGEMVVGRFEAEERLRRDSRAQSVSWGRGGSLAVVPRGREVVEGGVTS